MIKLLIRGSSIPAGKGVNKSYVDIINENKLFNNIEIINNSRIGDTSFDGIWTFYDDIYPVKPDILMLHFGIDDAFFPVYRSEFKENLVQIVRLSRNKFDTRILLLTSHTFENQYDMDTMNIYYRTIREVAVDLACELISIHTYWISYMLEMGMNYSELVQKDSRYPNEQGHKIYAEAIIKRLERIIHEDKFVNNSKCIKELH